MQRQQRHSWRERDGDELRFYRAVMFGKEWKIESQLKGEEEWNTHDPISRADWEMLRDILWRKYQRKRLPWKLVERIDTILEDLPDDADS